MWLHNTVNVINTTELYDQKWLYGKFHAIYTLPQFLENVKK